MDDALQKVEKYIHSFHSNKTGDVDWVLPMKAATGIFLRGCHSADLKSHMLQGGYLQNSVQILRDFKDCQTKILDANLQCFMDSPEYRNTMVDAGMIPAVIKVMNDLSEWSDEDPQSKHFKRKRRTFIDGIKILQIFAETNMTQHVAVVKAGAIDTILPMMTSEEWGLAPENVSCPAIRALVKGVETDPSLSMSVDLATIVLEGQCNPDADGGGHSGDPGAFPGDVPRPGSFGRPELHKILQRG